SVFAQPAAGDQWGIRTIQIILDHLDGPVAIDGKLGPKTQEKITTFQKQNGLAPDGDPGPATRKKLFRSYMDAICVDAQGKPFQISASRGFLARGADRAGKGDFQGCSEFNPRLIFSEKRNADFEKATDKTARNDANAPNRRVMALLFRPGSRVMPDRWP